VKNNFFLQYLLPLAGNEALLNDKLCFISPNYSWSHDPDKATSLAVTLR